MRCRSCASAAGQDLDCEEAGVDAAANRHGRDRYAAWHLHDGQKGIQAAQGRGRHGHADDGQGRTGGQHAGQMRRAAGACDQDLQAA